MGMIHKVHKITGGHAPTLLVMMLSATPMTFAGLMFEQLWPRAK
jgi:hypothetical protein